MTQARAQRTWNDISEGDQLAPVEFPLSIYRLVMAAATNRDFNAIHHNRDFAKASGAPDMYANTLFLQGMWERCVRDYIGTAGTIRALKGFRIRRFNPVGTTPVVRGHVSRKWREEDIGLAEITLRTVIGDVVTTGPGSMIVTLPMH